MFALTLGLWWDVYIPFIFPFHHLVLPLKTRSGHLLLCPVVEGALVWELVAQSLALMFLWVTWLWCYQLVYHMLMHWVRLLLDESGEGCKCSTTSVVGGNITTGGSVVDATIFWGLLVVVALLLICGKLCVVCSCVLSFHPHLSVSLVDCVTCLGCPCILSYCSCVADCIHQA